MLVVAWIVAMAALRIVMLVSEGAFHLFDRLSGGRTYAALGLTVATLGFTIGVIHSLPAIHHVEAMIESGLYGAHVETERPKPETTEAKGAPSITSDH